VIFKDPVNAFRLNGGLSHEAFQQAFGNGAPNAYASIQSASMDGMPFPAIAPRPSVYDGHPGFSPISEGIRSFFPGEAYANTAYLSQAHQPPFVNPNLSTQHPYPQQDNFYVGTPSASSGRCPTPNGLPIYRHTTGGSDSGIDLSPQDTMNGWAQPPGPTASQPISRTSGYAMAPLDISTDNSAWALPSHDAIHTPSSLSHTGTYYYRSNEHTDIEHSNNNIHEYNASYCMPSQSLTVKAEPEDDWFDVDSDEENAAMRPQLGDPSSEKMGLMIAMSAQRHENERRTVTSFLDGPNILSTYNPSYAASPLLDAHTARVFSHFITATGPMLNVCERNPSNPYVIFSGKPVPQSQRALWSYTIPMVALTNQALLHAMLALASLHISKIQQTPPTPSLRHYHYALRKIAKALGDQKKRRNVATLAATLLLGFYEVATAEHNKWNSHLSGARELISSIPYASMARRVGVYRRTQEDMEARTAQMHDKYANGSGTPNDCRHRSSNGGLMKSSSRIDKNLIGIIMGTRPTLNKYGHIVNESEPEPDADMPLTPEDVEYFDLQSDLFWWYAKQDTFQSIISGNRLLLAYDQWSDCPPRAPIGRQDAVYGTMDHLLLLMARLADFGGKDLPRKKRASLEAAKRAKQAQSQIPPRPGGQQAPPFYGMMPDPGPVRVPRGFDQAEHDRVYSAPAPSEAKSLEEAYEEAEAEWQAIKNAFEVFSQSLGPSFTPLSPEHMQPLTTPFGPAIYYRSYPIACVMTLYHCGLIILNRIQPSMPPAAIVAAGVAARQTAPYANTIGRICAGIQPVSNTAPLNPHHGAALMDVCMALFHAGVQYQDPAQRGWTITKLRDVARLTGWQTSTLIASGCETAWARAGQMGKGPPYERTMVTSANDQRVKGRNMDPRLMDHPPKDNNDRRSVHKNAATRVHWAMGILSVEEDMKEMHINN